MMAAPDDTGHAVSAASAAITENGMDVTELRLMHTDMRM
jgi:hypothetical protein